MQQSAASTRTPGFALIATGVTLALVSVLELSAGDARGDGDNPADSLRFLAEFGDLYAYSGLALVTGGVALVLAVLAIRRMLGELSLAFSTTSAFAVLSGGFLAVCGVMRMQAVGTVPHIQGLKESWGESAYLTVQIAGTQGLLSAGMMGLAAWLIALAIVFVRRGVTGPILLAVFPTIAVLILAIDLALPWFDQLSLDGVFVVYIASIIVGMPLCCIGYGTFLLLPRTHARLALAGARAGRPPSTAEH
jgi:hypothetical protein